MKILHTADWHLGQTFYEYSRYDEHVRFLDWLRRQIKERKIDVLLVAGDIFDGDATALADAGTLKELFLKIESVYGVYACLGNHDAGPSYDRMTEFLSEAGVRVLQDEAVVIDSRFVLAGRKDSFPIGGRAAGEPGTA